MNSPGKPDARVCFAPESDESLLQRNVAKGHLQTWQPAAPLIRSYDR